jgi:hypothetical protein
MIPFFVPFTSKTFEELSARTLNSVITIHEPLP